MTRARRRRRRGAPRAGIVIAAVVGVAAMLAVLVPAALTHDPLPVCLDTPAAFPAEIAGYGDEQLDNAATIMRAGADAGVGRDGQILGVMAAMGESSLRNIDYGDWETSGVTNPDGTRTSSIGLFQQQDWWGSVEQRMDPATAASLFYARLQTVAGWQDMAPTQAIHRVQINADPEHYAPYEEAATAVVDGLSGPCPTP